MAELVTFVPKAEVEAAQNLQEFIRMCRDDLTLFNDVNDFSWESHEWPGFNLAKLGNGNRKVTEDVYLDGEFLNFARAYYRYKQSHNPTRSKDERYALLAIEAALVEKFACGALSNISKHVLDDAVRLAENYYSGGKAYSIGREIRNIARFLNEKKLVTAHVADWRSPVKRPNDRRNTGSVGQKSIDSKLPSDEAIHAMAEMFASDPDDPLTIFGTSVFALLLGSGFRIGELLDLKVDAEVNQPTDDGELRYGLRYEGEKGWGSDIKWIEKTYTDVCKEAFHRLLKLSEAGRACARHMEENHDVPYAWNGSCVHDVDDALASHELAELFGEGFGVMGLKVGDTFRNCHERIALKRLPEGFPAWPKTNDSTPDMKWSEALFCYRANELSSKKRAINNVLWRPSANTLNYALGPRPRVRGHRSLFDRNGYKMPDGSPMKITSHQARHFLSTVAERGGMAQEDIARFFGRADMKHNRVYNHMTDAELVEKAETLSREIKLFGADEQVRMRLPVSTVEFNALVDKIPVHATEYGFCVHDYTMSPCEKFRDCINCTEQVCVKGNDEKLARLKTRLEMDDRQLKAHLRAMEEGRVGANRWFEHAEKTVERLKELIAIMESDQVEDGAVIKLRDAAEHSHLGRAMAMKAGEAEQIEKQRKVEDRALDLVSQYRLIVDES